MNSYEITPTIFRRNIKPEYIYVETEGKLVDIVEMAGTRGAVIRDVEPGPFDFVLTSSSEAKILDPGHTPGYVGEKVLEGTAVEIYRNLNPQGVQTILRTLGFQGTVEEFLKSGNKRTINYQQDRRTVLGKMLRTP